jgi:hypothetical protein
MQMRDDDDLNPQLQDPELQTREKPKEKKRKTKKDLLLLWYYRLFMNCKSVI